MPANDQSPRGALSGCVRRCPRGVRGALTSIGTRGVRACVWVRGMTTPGSVALPIVRLGAQLSKPDYATVPHGVCAAGYMRTAHDASQCPAAPYAGRLGRASLHDRYAFGVTRGVCVGSYTLILCAQRTPRVVHAWATLHALFTLAAFARTMRDVCDKQRVGGAACVCKHTVSVCVCVHTLVLRRRGQHKPVCGWCVHLMWRL